MSTSQHRRLFVCSALLLAGFATTRVPSAQSVALPDVLARAAGYHAEYTKAISGVQLEEQMQLRDVSGGQMRTVSRISSDLVLVNVNGEVVALRDPFAVDTRPLRDRTSRILKLLGAPAAPTRGDWGVASAIPAESAVYLLLDVIAKVNQPTTALQFIAARQQPSLKYRLDGRRKINGVDLVGVRFEEPEGRDTKYMLHTRGNARATGRFWVDPATGAIHQTELWVDGQQSNLLNEHAIVSVKYAPNTALGLLLPTEMIDSYEEFEGRETVFRRNVESRATYSNATFAAIDLTRLR